MALTQNDEFLCRLSLKESQRECFANSGRCKKEVARAEGGEREVREVGKS